jgi:hypothetical protein
MSETLLMDDRVTTVATATAEGESLWIPLRDLEGATGWSLKPEGACRGEACVPIPPSRTEEFARDQAFNIAALARHLGQPLLHDSGHHAWALGETGGSRAGALRSLQAPDFTLPDLDGRDHSLHDHLGEKVFLVSWASW